jgi:hypothetical protein
MFGAAAVVVLSLLPRYAALLTTDAKCLSGYDWMFSSISQSPCDVAAELAGVCVGGQFNLSPLDVGYVYLGPSTANANTCRCSSVYYSLLSACAYCQGRNYLGWSGYSTNCSTVYVTVYTQQIPVGVKVPAYAYQDVSVADTFNVTLAQSIKGVESSRPATASTATAINKSASSIHLPTSSSAGSQGGSTTNIPAIVGGVIGGVVGLGLIGALIAFLVFRSKQSKTQAYSSYQQSPNMAYTPNTTGPLISNVTPGSPASNARVYDPNDPSTFPSADANMHGSYSPYSQPADPYRHQSPFNPNLTTNHTGNSAPNYGGAQSMPVPQHTGVSHYSGAPEL